MLSFPFITDTTCGNYPEILCGLRLSKLRFFPIQTVLIRTYITYTRGDFYICLLGFWPSVAKTLRGQLQFTKLIMLSTYRYDIFESEHIDLTRRIHIHILRHVQCAIDNVFIVFVFLVRLYSELSMQLCV